MVKIYNRARICVELLTQPIFSECIFCMLNHRQNLIEILFWTVFSRLVSLMNGAEIAIGGKTSEEDKYIEPTVLINVKRSDAVMEEEIFGPILPIITVENAYDALQFVNDGWVRFCVKFRKVNYISLSSISVNCLWFCTYSRRTRRSRTCSLKIQDRAECA